MNGFSGATSSNGSRSPASLVWKRVWHANVSPNVCIFSWKFFKNILPTRDLLARRIPLDDQRFVLCLNSPETALHLFKQCPATAYFWLHNPLGLRARDHPDLSLTDWIVDLMGLLSKLQLNFFFFSLWAIWTERNKVLWKGGSCNPANMVGWAMRLLEEFHSFRFEEGVYKRR